MALRRAGHDRRPPDHLARDPRQRVRLRQRHRGPPPAGVGLARGHRRQRPALQRLHRRHLRSGLAAAAVRPGRAPGVLHHHQHLRLVAVVADQVPPRARRAGDHASVGPGGRAPRLLRRLGRGAPALPVALLGDRRRLAGPALVLLVRRLDLRRLDDRHLRDGEGLERLLAVLDRRRPGRRTPAVAQPLLPDRDPLRRLRRARGLGLRGLAESQPHRKTVGRRGGPAYDRQRAPSAWTPSSARSPTSRPARPSSSSTTRTARTRATSSSPPPRRPRS